jgi:glycosyltransferase involved in cell wall biosynthesis
MIDIVYERQWSSLSNLVQVLIDLNKMGTLYGGFPKWRYINAGIPREILQTNPTASLANFVISKIGLPSSLMLDEPKIIGNWVAKFSDLSETLIVNGTAYRFLFPKLKDSARKLILERGSMHPCEFFRLNQKARKEAGYSYTDKIPASIVDEIEKTALADFIIAGSQMVRQSYVDHGYPVNRIFDCSYGIDAEKYSYIQRKIPKARPIKIGIMGVVGFRKGLLRLLKIGSWARRKGYNVEIHFAGPISDIEAHDLLQKTDARYYLHGVLKGSAQIQFLENCDLYAIPSYEEGLPFSLLEAMSTGLLAIVSNDTGAREVVEHNRSGFILQSFSDDEFDSILQPLFSSPERIINMGKYARKRITSEYSYQNYFSRINHALNFMNV